MGFLADINDEEGENHPRYQEFEKLFLHSLVLVIKLYKKKFKDITIEGLVGLTSTMSLELTL